MSTYDYALPGKKDPKLFCEHPEKRKQQQRDINAYTSEMQGAEEVWEEMQRHQRREQRRRLRAQSRKHRRIVITGAVLLAGVIAVWGLGSRHGDDQTVGAQIQARQDAGQNTGQNTGQHTRSGGTASWGTVSWEEAAAKSTDNMREDDLLLLVNKDHALPEDYEIQLYWLQNKSCAVSVEMYDALKEMLTDGSTDGREFVVASGYRDTAYQKKLLEEDIESSMANEGLTYQQAYEKETRETMPPGYSEHETGLAVDIVSLNYQILDEQQENTPENRWLQENCSRYGFILRYPKGKGDITGIDYEAWHFRYVGREAAQEIMSRGITLEEYLGEA